jgi:hypothetical protein
MAMPESVTVLGPLDPCGPNLFPSDVGYDPLNAALYQLCRLEHAAAGGVSSALRAFLDELWAEWMSFFAKGTVLGDAIDWLHTQISNAWDWIAAEANAAGQWLTIAATAAAVIYFLPEIRRAIDG